ncbi:hypothetical protein ACFL2G_03895 [Candidatus Omnitrophota bacterium]
MTKEYRRCSNLSKKHICFLDTISKKCRFSNGKNLCRTSIIRALLKACKRLDIDVCNVKTEKELKRRVVDSFKKH